MIERIALSFAFLALPSCCCCPKPDPPQPNHVATYTFEATARTAIGDPPDGVEPGAVVRETIRYEAMPPTDVTSLTKLEP